jgi:hypothetical protein
MADEIREAPIAPVEQAPAEKRNAEKVKAVQAAAEEGRAVLDPDQVPAYDKMAADAAEAVREGQPSAAEILVNETVKRVEGSAEPEEPKTIGDIIAKKAA